MFPLFNKPMFMLTDDTVHVLCTVDLLWAWPHRDTSHF